MKCAVRVLFIASVLFLLLAGTYGSRAQDLVHFRPVPGQFDRQLGTVFVSGSVTIGSAFAFGSKKEVVTCDHVVAAAMTLPEGTNLFFRSATAVAKLRLKYRLPKYDLAVLTPDPPIAGEPLVIGDFKKIRPGDQIVYVGYDQQASTNGVMSLIHAATVSATGSVMNDGKVVDFLEFPGLAVPGYSGGAVLNYKGELVAVIREAWTRQGVKGGPPLLFNRAFSLDVLNLEGEVFSANGASTNSTGTSAALSDLINLSAPLPLPNR